jgi:prepilin-type processing-associated H-X9-DG protein
MARRLLSFCRTPSGTSVLAAIAFVFSLASFFLSAGLAAIVLGWIVLRRARRSGQAIRGRRIAKAAVVLSILIPVFLFLFAAVNSVHTITPELSCQTNLCRLGKAMLMYANEHNNQLPAPSRWCDLLVSVGRVDPNHFRCRGTQENPWKTICPVEVYLCLRHRSANQQKGPCDYAMNEHATSLSLEPDVVLCHETRSGWNQVGGPELLTTDHHDGRGCNIMFLDTHVEFVPAERLGQLKWKPTK